MNDTPKKAYPLVSRKSLLELLFITASTGGSWNVGDLDVDLDEDALREYIRTTGHKGFVALLIEIGEAQRQMCDIWEEEVRAASARGETPDFRAKHGLEKEA
jgi:hypothetical protein